jgi:Flp pilus assembly protein TadD
LVGHAARRSSDVLGEHVTQGMIDEINNCLAGSGSIYDPDSACIRLAKIFERRACEDNCLTAARADNVVSGSSGDSSLPATVSRLATLQPGYELLATARSLEKSGQQAEALATYLQAASITPDEPRILGSLGLAYLRAGQLQPARLHLQKAVKLQPDYYRTRMGLGYLYLQQGKIGQAKNQLASSVSLLPVPENLFLLAEAKEQDGDLAAARALYQLVVESDRASKLGLTSASRLAEMAGAR